VIEKDKEDRAANHVVRRAKVQAQVLALVADRLNDLRFGSIEIRVYRGVVTNVRVVDDIKVT